MIISELLLPLAHMAQHYRKLWVKNMNETSGIFDVINRSKDDINVSWDMGRDEKQKDLCSFDIINFSNKNNKKFSVFIMLNGCGIFGFSLLLQSPERNKQPLNLSNVMLKENRSSSKWMRWSCVVFHKCSTISFAVVQAANLGVHPRSVIVKSSISHFKMSSSV